MDDLIMQQKLSFFLNMNAALRSKQNKTKA